MVYLQKGWCALSRRFTQWRFKNACFIANQAASGFNQSAGGCGRCVVKARVLLDDHCGIIVSHDGSRVLYDKETPRTEVSINRL